MDRACLKMGNMSDHTVVANNRWLLGCGVHNGVVLDAGPCPNDDVAIVATEDGPRPDGRMRSYPDVADDHCFWMDESHRINGRNEVAKGVDSHASTVVAGGIPRFVPVPYRAMSRRLDIELTSNRNDGTWTWRAAGAKSPKGVVREELLGTDLRVGKVFKVEAETDLDGIEVIAVVAGREKNQKIETLEILGSGREFEPVTQKLARRDKGPRKDKGPRRGPKSDGPRGERPQRRNFVNPPELPKRPAAKRLKPKRVHRAAILDSLPAEHQAVAERALTGGLKAVRDAVKAQNDQLKKDGKPLIPAEGLVTLAQDLLPKLRVAEWLDKAEAAKADLETLDLRDLRSVVVGSDDPMVVRDESTRVLAAELKAALKSKIESEQSLWLADIAAAIDVQRVVRALKVSSEPPKAGQPFPAELANKLAQAASTALAAEDPQDRWITVLEAVAFSPVRSSVKPAAIPAQPSEALLTTVKRLAPLIPHIAAMFGVTVEANAVAPKPLRPARPERAKKKPATPRVSNSEETVAAQ